MKLASIIALSGACLVPAIVLSSCSESPLDKFVSMAEVQVELGNICKEVTEGKLTPAEGAEKINELKKSNQKYMDAIKAMQADETQKEEMKKLVEEFEKSDKGKELKKQVEEASDHVVSAAIKIKDAKFQEALTSFSK